VSEAVIEGRLVLPTTVAPGQVHIAGDTIESVVTDSDAFKTPSVRLHADECLAPGFVDIQLNGAFGKEFKTDEDAVSSISRGLPEFGTTAFCPTVTTMSSEAYPTWLSRLAVDGSQAIGARPLGFHLEGPALNPAKVGAQNADWLKAPDQIDESIYHRDDIRIVTLAPELSGAWPMAGRLIDHGVRVGIGHTLIEYADLVQGFDPDHMLVVHAFNAMADLNSRRPGVIGAVLDRDDYYCSVIADRIHVSDPTLRILWKAKRDKSKIIGITDGSAVTGLPVGIHQIGVRSIEKREDRAVLEGTETLVGSTLTLDAAVRNLCVVTGSSLPEAIACVTLNPATLLGCEDRHGSIAGGSNADLVTLDGSLRVVRTMVGGNIAWER
jgi:N-acetylglucosamine-6-phosphate deacetylase